MTDNYFLDTNVLVYSFDSAASDKKTRISRELITEGLLNGKGALSTQVLQEFFVAMTGKINEPFSCEEVRSILQDFESFQLVIIDKSLIYRASILVEKEPLSFWDALICSAADRAGCDKVYTEDLNHGQEYGDVLIQNPFQQHGEGEPEKG